MFARVALDLPIPTEFTYAVPERLLADLRPGQRVRVPFRRGVRVGYLVALEESTAIESPKEIAAIVDPEPLVSRSLLELARWISGYYGASFGESLQAVLPGGVRRGRPKERRVFRIPGAEPPARARKAAPLLEALASFEGAPTPARLCAAAGCSDAALRTLVRAGVLRIETRDVEEAFDEAPPSEREAPHTLEPAQAAALEAIRPDVEAPRFAVHLLLGVTGSGKTEVYLRAIEEAVRRGRQAIVLVPEIALTPQTVRSFRARFERVSVLHSAQSATKRRREWQRIFRGEADVVVGPRSAIFSPTERLGLVVVDEEHEGSFKQQDAPRYHARDVAIVRARSAGIPVILGSATPSLETYANALRGRYRLHRLPGRVGGLPLPPVERVDLSAEPSRLFSRRLRIAVADAVAAGGQVILFLNRRGFATIVLCSRCHHRIGCPHCSAMLVFHKGRRRTICHLCGHEAVAPAACPECRAPALEYVGSGTERVFEEAREAWPGVPLVRVDSDTARGEAIETALETFRRGDAKILVGTQMVAKGLHFPSVTLVGIVNADTALHLPDFRANERTFHLIAQVAGRAGRGSAGGRVIVQTYFPEHYAIEAAARHDYEGFARRELEEREVTGLPPYRRAALFVVGAEEDARGEAAAARLREAIRFAAGEHGVELRGPVYAPIRRVKARWRRMILALSATPRGIAAVAAAARAFRPPAKVDLLIDVDPVAVL